MSEPGLTVCQQPPVSVASYVQNPPVAPSKAWRDLVDHRHSTIPQVLTRALRELVDGMTRDEARATLLEGHDVRGLSVQGVDGIDATDDLLADYLLDLVAPRDETAFWEAQRLLRQLGSGGTSAGLTSTLDDIRAVLRVFEAADVVPTVAIHLPEQFRDYRREQRRKFLAWLCDLADVMDVRLVTSTLEATWLATAHESDVPPSVNDAANPRLHSGSPVAATETARAALDDLGDDHPALDLLAMLDERGSQRAPYTALYDDARVDVGRSAVRHRAGVLDDHDLVDRARIDGDHYLVLRPAGVAALDLLCARDSTRAVVPAVEDAGAETAAEADAEAVTGGEGSPEDGAGCTSCGFSGSEGVDASDAVRSVFAIGSVSDPRTLTASAVLPPKQAREGGGVGSAVAADAVAARDDDLRTDYLSYAEHHAIASAAQSAEIALDDRRVQKFDDPRAARVSFDEERDEAVVEAEWDGPLPTAARLCAALTSDALVSKAMPATRLDEDGVALGGLVESNAYLLRRTRCLGYLKDANADGESYLAALRQARVDLLSRMPAVGIGTDDYNHELAGDLLREAHGIIGTVSQLLDLLDVDLVRHIRVPEYARNIHDKRHTLTKFLSTAIPIGARYGHFSAYRVLYEGREDKREDLLCAPEVTRPNGDLIGSWVLSGPGISRLDEDLRTMDRHLDLQDEAEKFARFLLDVQVGDAMQRSTVAAALSRMASIKRLDPTRRSVSLLHALCDSTASVTEAVMNLGSQRLGEDRDLELGEVRWALSTLDHRRLLRDVGRPAVSKVLKALLRAETPVSKADLAALAGVSKRGITRREKTDSGEATTPSVRDVLEAAGLLVVDETGPGKADLYRLALPFREERRETDAPAPTWLCEETVDGFEVALQDALAGFLDAFGHSLVGSDLWIPLISGEVGVDDVEERWPVLAPWTSTLVALVDPGGGDRGEDDVGGPPATVPVIQFGQAPRAEQTTLDDVGVPAW
ncbi:hypothetical protein [Halomarina oriensis]|uniref:Uncharacterized protein n=1 Tax=Halomarina oriensis TaxID=671145 RepID=A0A6B0GI70_9EURY|nr:hypothetical protein [Halomarina oriensis]MWG33129.1 hypothetical protein [Halomarina oriensis]